MCADAEPQPLDRVRDILSHERGRAFVGLEHIATVSPLRSG